MLKLVKNLEKSLTLKQVAELNKILGSDLYNLLDFAFESSTEPEASARVASFVDEAKGNRMKIFKARKILNDDQKNIVMKMLEGDVG